MSLSAVLPLKYENHKTNSFQQCKLLFQSLLKFGQNLHFEEFLVVTPKQDMARIEQELEPYSAYLPLRYIDEKDLILDATIRRGVGGWRKQQLIKLAVSSIIHSAYYITFDADVLLKNTLSNEDLIIKGKALLQHQHKSVRPHWWKGSAEILKIDPEMDNLGMDVTPALLHTQTVQNLKNYLSQMEGRTWINQLLLSYYGFPKSLWKKSIPWTEYTLYYLFLSNFGKLEEVHQLSEKPILLSKKSVWSTVDFDQWDPTIAFQQDKVPFLVVQSNKQIPMENLREKLSPYLN